MRDIKFVKEDGKSYVVSKVEISPKDEMQKFEAAEVQLEMKEKQIQKEKEVVRETLEKLRAFAPEEADLSPTEEKEATIKAVD